MCVEQGSGDGLSLIQRLAQLSVHQSGTELQEVDPDTGAVRPRRILGDPMPSPGRGLKDVKTARSVPMHTEGQPPGTAGELTCHTC